MDERIIAALLAASRANASAAEPQDNKVPAIAPTEVAAMINRPNGGLSSASLQQINLDNTNNECRALPNSNENLNLASNLAGTGLVGTLSSSVTSQGTPPGENNQGQNNNNETGQISTLQALQLREQQIRNEQNNLMVQRIALLRAKQREEQRMLEQRQLEELRLTINLPKDPPGLSSLLPSTIADNSSISSYGLQAARQLLGLPTQEQEQQSTLPSSSVNQSSFATIRPASVPNNPLQQTSESLPPTLIRQLDELRRSLNPNTQSNIQRNFLPQSMGLFTSLPPRDIAIKPEDIHHASVLPGTILNSGFGQAATSRDSILPKTIKATEVSSVSTSAAAAAAARIDALDSSKRRTAVAHLSNVSDIDDADGDKKRPGRPRSFPRKLFEMLTDIDRDGGIDAKIVSFLPHGRAFMISDPAAFEKDVMPKYFRMMHYSSFQRQLNHYEIRRIMKGPDRGAYYHELLIRGHPEMCEKIERQRINGG